MSDDISQEIQQEVDFNHMHSWKSLKIRGIPVEKFQHGELSLILNITAILFLRQVSWLFIYASKYIFSKNNIAKPSQNWRKRSKNSQKQQKSDRGVSSTPSVTGCGVPPWPGPMRGTWGGVLPQPGPIGGYPRWGTPRSNVGYLRWGTPTMVPPRPGLMEGTQGGVPPSRGTWSDRGTPHVDLAGVPFWGVDRQPDRHVSKHNLPVVLRTRSVMNALPEVCCTVSG